MEVATVSILVPSRGEKFLQSGQDIYSTAIDKLQRGQYTADIEEVDELTGN